MDGLPPPAVELPDLACNRIHRRRTGCTGRRAPIEQASTFASDSSTTSSTIQALHQMKFAPHHWQQPAMRVLPQPGAENHALRGGMPISPFSGELHGVFDRLFQLRLHVSNWPASAQLVWYFYHRFAQGRGHAWPLWKCAFETLRWSGSGPTVAKAAQDASWRSSSAYPRMAFDSASRNALTHSKASVHSWPDPPDLAISAFVHHIVLDACLVFTVKISRLALVGHFQGAFYLAAEPSDRRINCWAPGSCQDNHTTYFVGRPSMSQRTDPLILLRSALSCAMASSCRS